MLDHTCSGRRWGKSVRGTICWLSCQLDHTSAKVGPSIENNYAIILQIMAPERMQRGRCVCSSSITFVTMQFLLNIVNCKNHKNEKWKAYTADQTEAGVKDDFLRTAETPTFECTHLLNSKRALVDSGTPFSGHERKWNWVTVRVSPVRMFLR